MSDPSDPSAGAPRPPDPGLFKALAWLVVLLVANIVFVTSAVRVTGIRDWRFITAAGTLGSFLPAFMIISFKFGDSAARKFALRSPGRPRLVLVFLLTAPMYTVAGEISDRLAELGTRCGFPAWMVEYPASYESFRESDPWTTAPLIVVFIGLLPGFGEELFFRGFLGRGLVARYGIAKGMLLTALLFGASHLHPLHAAMAALIGLVLHSLYFWTRSLAAPIFLHTAYNCTVMLGQALPPKYYEAVFVYRDSPVLALSAFSACSAILLLLYRARVRWVNADGTDWSPGFPSAETPPHGSGTHLAGRGRETTPIALVIVSNLVFLAALGRELLGQG